MGCGNEICNWDAKAVQDSKSGKNTEPALKISDELKPSRIVASRYVLNSAVKFRVDDLRAILTNPGDPRHEQIQKLLETALSHGQLTSTDEVKLAPALKTVLDLQKHPQGLFETPPVYRGPGASSMQHGAELLTAAAIIQKAGVNTSLGNKLKILYTDTIGFGQKLASNYAVTTRKAATIEADTLIVRKGECIGIDTKYSKSSDKYSVTHELDRELRGIKNCYNSGALREFYFISNVKFSEPFKEMVEEHNIEIFKDRLREDAEFRSNFGKYLTEEERKSGIPENFEKYDFKGNMQALREASERYGVPQTGLCENVYYS